MAATSDPASRAPDRSGVVEWEHLLQTHAGAELAFEPFPREIRDVDHATGRGDPLPQVPQFVGRMFLCLSRIDRSLLERGNLPFGSWVLVAATKRGPGTVPTSA